MSNFKKADRDENGVIIIIMGILPSVLYRLLTSRNNI